MSNYTECTETTTRWQRYSNDKSISTHVSHIGISIPDIEAAVKFYTEVLGWYLIMEPNDVIEDDGAIGVMW